MDTAEFLRMRIAQASPNDTILGLMFESSLKYIAAEHGAERANAMAREISKDMAKGVVSFFKYPVSDLLKLVERGTGSTGGGRFHDLLEKFGSAAVGNFFDSAIGKTMMLLGGTNPHRLMSSAPAGYKALASYGDRSYSKTSESSAQMTFKYELLGPAWQMGVIRKALEACCKLRPSMTCQIQNSSASDFTLDVKW